MCLSVEKKVISMTEQADEAQKYLEETRNDLCKYYNSAFFQEDSRLIKELHEKVSKMESVPPPAPPVQAPSWPNRGTNEPRRNTAPRRTKATIKGKLPTVSERPTKLKTVLVTDSIMRHISNEDALGMGHSLTVINRRSWTTLNRKSQETLDELIAHQPHFIYIHLGVNDHLKQVLLLKRGPLHTHFRQEFLQKLEQELPNASITVSLPLLTNHSSSNARLIQFRVKMRSFCQDNDLCYENHKNFRAHLLANDGLHPNDSGKEYEVLLNAKF
eukprot:sb/3468133/